MTYEPPTTENPYGSYKPERGDHYGLTQQGAQNLGRLYDRVDELERDVRFLFIMVVVLLIANVLLAVLR